MPGGHVFLFPGARLEALKDFLARQAVEAEFLVLDRGALPLAPQAPGYLLDMGDLVTSARFAVISGCWPGIPWKSHECPRDRPNGHPCQNAVSNTSAQARE